MNAVTPASRPRTWECDEQPVVAVYHAAALRSAPPSRRRSGRGRTAPHDYGWLRHRTSGSSRRRLRRRTPRPSSRRQDPVLAGMTVSSAPPAAERHNRPPASCASSGTIPKSSSPGSSVIAATAVQLAEFVIDRRPRKARRDPLSAERCALRSRRRQSSAGRPASAGADREIDTLVGDQCDTTGLIAQARPVRWKYSVSPGINHCRSRL